MTCRALHNRVRAKCAILLKDEQKTLSFAKIACSFVIMFPHSKGLANTFCIELAFDPRHLDRVTTNNLCQAFLSLPYLAEFNIQFPMGSARAESLRASFRLILSEYGWKTVFSPYVSQFLQPIYIMKIWSPSASTWIHPSSKPTSWLEFKTIPPAPVC